MIKITLLLVLTLCLTVNASLMNFCKEPPSQFPFDLSQFAGRWLLLASSNNYSVADCAQLNNVINPGNNSKALAETIKYLK